MTDKWVKLPIGKALDILLSCSSCGHSWWNDVRHPKCPECGSDQVEKKVRK